MSEKKLHHHPFLPPGEPPIEVPPVEEAWSLMRQQLNTSMPVRPWYTRFKFWSIAGGMVSVTAIVLLVMVHNTKNQNINASKNSTIPVSPDQEEIKNNFPVSKKQETTGKKSDDRIVISPADNQQENAHAKIKDSAENKINKNLIKDEEEKIIFEKESLSANKNNFENKSLLTIDDRSDKGSTVTKKDHRKKYEDVTGNMPPGKIRSDNKDIYFSGKKRNSDARNTYSLERMESHVALAESAAMVSDSYIRFVDSVMRVISSAHKKSNGSNSGNALDKSVAKEKNKSNRRKKPEFLMSAGLSLKKNFPVSGQQAASYNVNAGSNLVSDFIPAPYFRYFINDKIYVELALQINSPQYTRMQLIDSTADSSRLPGWQQDIEINAITLQKLYYTEIPLTVHYRLFDNFYIGAGLQYSKLWNGIAAETVTMHPSNGIGPDTLFSSEIIKLKSNADAYSKINRTDWRILIEAGYRLKRFTFGLRYQQGLNTYLPVRPDGSAGKDKNAAIGVKLQYDLWRQER